MSIHLRARHDILHTIFVGEKLLIVTTEHEFSNIVPPLSSNTIVLPVGLPDTDTAKTLPDHVGTGDALVEVIVRIRGTVPAVVGTEIVALVLSILSLTARLESIVNIHMRSEVGVLSKHDRGVLEFALELSAHCIGGGRPQFVFHTCIRSRECPGHLDAHHVVGHQLLLDGIGILLEHEKGGDRNVRTGSVVRHDGFSCLTFHTRFRSTGIFGRAETGIVGNDDTGCSCTLGIAHFLNKSTMSPIHHQDEGSRPRFHFPILIRGTGGKAPTHVHLGTAQIVICVVDILLNRSSVIGDTKQGLAMIVSAFFYQRLGKMNLEFT
mmetsp:Transcript_31351/g.72160  ORF Transcript_31351/g.72160 Transcript_31351/m.72160 type:complete len:322 (+) Transcript_31351:592-1557(+)